MKDNIYQTQLENGRLRDSGSFPKVILIDTTSYCNLRCSMCSHKDMKRGKGIMSWGLFTKVIDEIAVVDKGVRVWMVFFGEALILKKQKPTIFDMIGYAKTKGLVDVVLNSNANLLDREAGRGLIDSGLDAIYIGIDAFSSEIYSRLRVGGDYKKVVNNVIDFINLKKLLKSEKPDVYVQFVVMDINKDEQEDFKRFWTKQGAIVKIRPKISWAGLIEAPDQILDNKDRWPCHWAMQTISIIHTGEVVLCPCDLDARYIAGSLNNNTIKEVWNGDFKRLRLMHQNKQFELLPEMCRMCRDWQSARSEYFGENT